MLEIGVVFTGKLSINLEESECPRKKNRVEEMLRVRRRERGRKVGVKRDVNNSEKWPS